MMAISDIVIALSWSVTPVKDFLWFAQTENDDLSSYGMSVGASFASSGYFSVAAFMMSTMNGK